MGQMGPTRDMGPCAIVWSDTQTDASIGETFGDTTFTATSDSAPVREDRWGTSDVDQIFTGESCQVKVPFTRMSLAELAGILPGASGSGTSGNQMVIKSVVGRSMYENAKMLTLKPIIEGSDSSDTSEWLTVYRAYPRPDLELTYNVDGQRIYTVTFLGFRVQVNGTPAGALKGYLWKMGA